MVQLSMFTTKCNVLSSRNLFLVYINLFFYHIIIFLFYFTYHFIPYVNFFDQYKIERVYLCFVVVVIVIVDLDLMLMILCRYVCIINNEF